MERLNYFNAYSADNENQLTRAYLVLLKHSFHAFALFMDYCRSCQVIEQEKGERPFYLGELLEYGWEIDTQKGNPLISSNWLQSVLITDSVTASGNAATVSERSAVYDGIISFGSLLTIIIENKPRSGNVWFEQLNPSREGLSEDTKLFSNTVHLEWKEIIRRLNHLLNLPSLSGYEKMMTEDFLSFIDNKFPHLNPFDSFALCKGNAELIGRRIQNLLKSLVIDEDLVRAHRGWGYHIVTPYPEVTKIGLIYSEKENEWLLELSLYFGNTQGQSQALYKTNPRIDHLGKDWWIDIDFHFSYQSTNLVSFKKAPNTKAYIEFWKQNIKEIYQHQKEDIQEYVDWLKAKKVLTIQPEEEERLKTRFFKSKIPVLNICPGFGAIYEITGRDAEEMDKNDVLKNMLRDAIKEGLQIIGKDGHEFLK